MKDTMALADCHVHSDFSYDSYATIADNCAAACQKGLSVLTITDHCDMYADKNGYQHYFPIAEMRVETVKEASKNWEGKLTVLNGLELGDVANNPTLAEQHLKDYAYDFVLGAVHHPRDGSGIDIRLCPPGYILELYLNELEALLDFGNFDALAHLDYPARIWNHPGRSFIQLRERIDHILARVADSGLAIEINTGGIRDEMGRIGPEQWVLEDFKALGGKYITLGSDAHHSEDIGDQFAAAVDMIRRAGFDSVVYYKNRKPIPIML